MQNSKYLPSHINTTFLYFLWLLLFATLALLLPNSIGDVGLNGYQIARGTIVLGVFYYITLTIFLLKYSARDIFKDKLISLYFLFGSISFLSFTYSGATFVTLSKSFEIITDTFFVLLIYNHIRTMQDVSKFWNFTLCFIALLFGFYIFMTLILNYSFISYKGYLPSWSGYGSTNSISAMATCFAIVSFSRIIVNDRINHWNYIFLFTISIILLLFSASRTSIFILFFVLIPLCNLMHKKKINIIIFSLIGLIVIFTMHDHLFSYIIRGQTAAEFSSLTGRTNMWPMALEMFYEEPILGYGYYYASRYLFGSKLNHVSENFSNIDNMYIELLLGGGVISLGVILVLFFLIGRRIIALYKVSKIFEKKYFTYFIESSLIIVFTILRSFFNPTIQSHHWNLLLFLASLVVIGKFKCHYKNTIL